MYAFVQLAASQGCVSLIALLLSHVCIFSCWKRLRFLHCVEPWQSKRINIYIEQSYTTAYDFFWSKLL